jgi:AcrR family transcriptional regulator
MAPERVRTAAPPTGRSTDPSRRQRSDAKRNAVALVEAAKTVFAGSGVDAPAKEITDLAGVGVGTLYRHFPRRSDLIVAVLQHEIDECVAAAEELGTTLSPWEALIGWIERFTDFVGTKRGLASALHSGDPAYDDLPQHLMDRLEPALQTLLARAADGGYARDDVTAREVLMTIALICQPVPGEQPSFNQHMTRVFIEGLGRVAKAGAEPVEGGGPAECGAVVAGGPA